MNKELTIYFILFYSILILSSLAMLIKPLYFTKFNEKWEKFQLKSLGYEIELKPIKPGKPEKIMRYYAIISLIILLMGLIIIIIFIF